MCTVTVLEAMVGTLLEAPPPWGCCSGCGSFGEREAGLGGTWEKAFMVRCSTGRKAALRVERARAWDVGQGGLGGSEGLEEKGLGPTRWAPSLGKGGLNTILPSSSSKWTGSDQPGCDLLGATTVFAPVWSFP